MKDGDKVSTACSLTTEELRDREATLLALFRSGVLEILELQEGFAVRLPGDGKSIRLLAELMVAERQCCPFLTFEITALPTMGPVTVRMVGPAGTKELLRAILCKEDTPT